LLRPLFSRQDVRAGFVKPSCLDLANPGIGCDAGIDGHVRSREERGLLSMVGDRLGPNIGL
jgi:hypothetical protein